MKKIIAVILVLCLVLAATSAVAETRSYFLIGVQDDAGNVVDYESDPDFPVLVFTVDDETMTCAFGSDEEPIGGTCQIIEQTDTTLTLAISLEDGEELIMIYVPENDSFAYVDEKGCTYVLANVETMAA